MLHRIEVGTPKSIAVTNLGAARIAAMEIGYPLIIRAAYTLADRQRLLRK